MAAWVASSYNTAKQFEPNSNEIVPLHRDKAHHCHQDGRIKAAFHNTMRVNIAIKNLGC